MLEKQSSQSCTVTKECRVEVGCGGENDTEITFKFDVAMIRNNESGEPEVLSLFQSYKEHWKTLP